ncbi:hypothetical protein, partial [Segatella copri]|uniref:hypothetical protein n=1 Tax=Segatella copri TaxID=165179 RepID=UPI001D176733
YILSSLREERLGEKGGAFFNGKEGRDDFRTPFFNGKEVWVGFRKNLFSKESQRISKTTFFSL